jgi:hypothetical protein
MLAQLICVDRRYQRINCFNIREVQALLKNKFFADLINSNDPREFLNQTMIGVRHKLPNYETPNPNFFLFYNYGTDLKSKNRISNYNTINFDLELPSLNSFSFLYDNISIALKDDNIGFYFL